MNSELSACLTFFNSPGPTHSFSSLQGKTIRPPSHTGVYGWYFREIPPKVPTAGCIERDGCMLLYVGIGAGSKGLERLKSHYTRDCSRSTLRKTLACLLADKLDVRLRLIREDGRIWLGDRGEEKLSRWMASAASVAWRRLTDPTALEPDLIPLLKVPLNLTFNETHLFYPTLSAMREKVLAEARVQPSMSRTD